MENDPEKAKAVALAGIKDNFDHIKFKMYGDKELDMRLLNTVRQVVGEKAMVISDPKQYLECLLSSPTYRDNNDHFSLTPKPGFGIEIDTSRLKNMCHSYFLL